MANKQDENVMVELSQFMVAAIMKEYARFDEDGDLITDADEYNSIVVEGSPVPALSDKDLLRGVGKYKKNKKSMRELIKSGEPIYIEAKVTHQWGFGEYLNEPEDGVDLSIGGRTPVSVILDGVNILVPEKGDK